MGFNYGSVNLVAVLVAAIAYFAVGMLWYSPALFGQQWMKLSGMKKSKKPKNMGGMMFIAFIANLVLAYVFAMLLGWFNVASASAGATMGFYVWLGFFATTQLGSFLWEQKPFQLYVINTSYMLVSLLVLGLILGAWV